MPGKMSKGFYIGGYFAGFAVGIVSMVAAGVTYLVLVKPNPSDGPPLALFAYIALAGLPMLFSLVVQFMFIYRMWASIQDGQARMTPGKAVGFSLIPIFNLYWMFPVFQGFAEDYNTYLAQRGLHLQRLNDQLFLSYPILVLFSAVPYLGMLASPVALVVLVLIISQTCDAVNALNQVPSVPAAAPMAARI